MIRGASCKFCDAMRVPGFPSVVERYPSEFVVCYISQYQCGTALEFTLDGNQYKNFEWHRNCKDPIPAKYKKIDF